jgi:transposase-like protein
MPFDQKYDPATREAATARVLERRATNPTDRSVLRVVSEEFGVGQQSLRAWVQEAEGKTKPVSGRRGRPRFSRVVTTKVERAGDQGEEGSPAPAPEVAVSAADDVTPPGDEGATPAADEPLRAETLEAEAATLRRGNDALKAAMRVLLAGS